MTVKVPSGGQPHGVGQAELINKVVQAGLEDARHLFAGDTAAAQGLFINATRNWRSMRP